MEDKEEEKLKAVFDVCDQNHNGYISADHFKALVTDHFGPTSEKEVISIIQLLDPSGGGKISFDNFREGVEQITQVLQLGRPRTSSVNSVTSTGSISDTNTLEFPNNSPPSPNSTDNCFVISSLSLLPQGDQTGQALSEDDHDSALSGRSSEINETSRTSLTDEENYEDYGESEADVTIASDLSANGSRKLTSAAFATKLHSRRDSLESGEDIIVDIDGDISHLNDKVQILSEQIRDLSKNQNESESRHISLKEENTSLVRKIHGLEEQLREMEFRSEERLRDEQNHHRDYVSRQDREKLEKLDYLTDRLQRSEQECDKSRLHVTHLQKENDRLKMEKDQLTLRLSEVLEECSSLREEQDLLLSKCQSQRREFEQERCATAGLLDELGKELEDLRKYKIDVEAQRRLYPDGLSELPSRYHDLQVEMQALKEENRSLTANNEELNAQIITMCMEEGRTLLQNTSGISWADEMETMDINELREALKDQQEVNQRLKMYVDKILLTILEKQPSLLEVKHW